MIECCCQPFYHFKYISVDAHYAKGSVRRFFFIVRFVWKSFNLIPCQMWDVNALPLKYYHYLRHVPTITEFWPVFFCRNSIFSQLIELMHSVADFGWRVKIKPKVNTWIIIEWYVNIMVYVHRASSYFLSQSQEQCLTILNCLVLN